MKKAYYESLFPPGGEIERKMIDPWGAGDAYSDEGCVYSSNEKGSLRITGNWERSDDPVLYASPEDILKEYEASDPRQFDGDFETWTWEGGVLAVAKCELKNADERSVPRDRYVLEIFTANYRLDGDQDEVQKDFGRVGEAAMKEVLPKLPCKKD